MSFLKDWLNAASVQLSKFMFRITGLTNMGDLFVANTFTLLDTHLYIVVPIYGTVKNDLK